MHVPLAANKAATNRYNSPGRSIERVGTNTRGTSILGTTKHNNTLLHIDLQHMPAQYVLQLADQCWLLAGSTNAGL
jgi:hypothetical protein